MFFPLAVFIAVVLLPREALAWGPMTHLYLGTELFLLGAALPGGIYGLIRKYRQDYLYGNIMADIILTKKYLPRKKNPHSWEVAMGLLSKARSDAEQAFCWGYLSHLAADTVAHHRLTNGRSNLQHTLLEVAAEHLIGRHYWLMAMSIAPQVQRRGDRLLERCLESPVVSFRTNKRLMKGMLLLSGLKPPLPQPLGSRRQGRIQRLHEESLERMLDVLSKGRASSVLKYDPMGHLAA